MVRIRSRALSFSFALKSQKVPWLQRFISVCRHWSLHDMDGCHASASFTWPPRSTHGFVHLVLSILFPSSQIKPPRDTNHSYRVLSGVHDCYDIGRLSGPVEETCGMTVPMDPEPSPDCHSVILAWQSGVGSRRHSCSVIGVSGTVSTPERTVLGLHASHAL